MLVYNTEVSLIMKPILQVDLSSIKDTPGLSLTVSNRLDLPNVSWEGERLLEFINPWRIELTVTNVKRGFQVSGKLNGSYRLNCDRCLEKVQSELTTDLEGLFLPEQTVNEIGGEDEEEATTITGDELDLSVTILEAITLQLPLKILCSPNCRGLCSVCGTNLNNNSCNCQPESLDPRLATLLQWKQDEGGGNSGQS